MHDTSVGWFNFNKNPINKAINTEQLFKTSGKALGLRVKQTLALKSSSILLWDDYMPRSKILMKLRDMKGTMPHRNGTWHAVNIISYFIGYKD